MEGGVVGVRGDSAYTLSNGNATNPQTFKPDEKGTKRLEAAVTLGLKDRMIGIAGI